MTCPVPTPVPFAVPADTDVEAAIRFSAAMKASPAAPPVDIMEAIYEIPQV